MPRALQAPDGSKKLAIRTKPPVVPLVKPIESTDLMLATLRRAPFCRSRLRDGSSSGNTMVSGAWSGSRAGTWI